MAVLTLHDFILFFIITYFFKKCIVFYKKYFFSDIFNQKELCYNENVMKKHVKVKRRRK